MQPDCLLEALNEVVGNVIAEALHTDVLNPMQRLNRHPVGKVTVADNSPRRAKVSQRSMVNACQAIPNGGQMKTSENKASFTVKMSPEVVLLLNIFTTVSSACHSSG